MTVSFFNNNSPFYHRHICLLIVLAVCLCIMTASGCIFSYTEPSKNPAITFLSISDGEVITTRDVTISWEGNAHAAYYQYIIDNVESEILSDNSVTLTDLDETEHLFIIKAFNDSLDLKSTPLLVNFTVDDLQGPGIALSPRRINESATLTIELIGISRLMAAHIEFVGENRCVTFGEFTPNTSLADTGVLISFVDPDSPGRFIIDIAFAGSTDGVSGSSLTLGTLTVIPQRTGNIIIDSSATIFRDTVNETITINELDYVSVVQ